MHSVRLSILDLDSQTAPDFEAAANRYVNELSAVHELQVDIPVKKLDGSRGDLPLWTDIIVTGVTTGAFMAIYTLAKDLFGIVANAEVELNFKDGSSIKLKHLTAKEAEEIIRNHLEIQEL